MDALRKLIPSEARGGFHEPFVGGASVFMSINPEIGSVNDMNTRLINFHRHVRDRPEDLIAYNRTFQRPGNDPTPELEMDPRGNRDGWPNDSYFYQQRARLNAADELGLSQLERAALFLYLNRCSFNGLYRENSDGIMNMARGSRTNPDWVRQPQIRAGSYSFGGEISPESTIENWSRDHLTETVQIDGGTTQIQSAEPTPSESAPLTAESEGKVNIHNDDFTYILEEAESGDVVYFDPPYQPLSETADFTSYTATGFTPEDRDRLWRICTQLMERDVSILVSDSGETEAQYRDLGFDIHFVDGKRCINANAENRGPVREVLATWYASSHSSQAHGTQSSLSVFDQ